MGISLKGESLTEIQLTTTLQGDSRPTYMFHIETA